MPRFLKIDEKFAEKNPPPWVAAGDFIVLNGDPLKAKRLKTEGLRPL